MPWTEADTQTLLEKINQHIAEVVEKQLAEGHSIVTARGNQLVRLHPDGTFDVLKELPPRYHVPIGTKLIIKKPEIGTDTI